MNLVFHYKNIKGFFIEQRETGETLKYYEIIFP